MTFSEALELIKNGQRVCRQGWNGKGMWLELVCRQWVKTENSGSVMIEEFICMRTAQSTYIPWVASQSDLLAHDWWEVY